MPRHVDPMLAMLSDLPADPQNYNFEFKWDGVRALCFHDGATLRLESRNQLDITPRYPELHTLARVLGKRSAILDGEVVAMDSNGTPSFPRLQRRMHVRDARAIQRLMNGTPVFYVLFDVVYLDGRWTGRRPYTERRRLLEELTVAGPSWQITPAHLGEGKTMLEAARENRLEGIVAKRLDSTYEPGRRSPAWLKIKIIQRQEFVIGGWIPEASQRANRIGAIQIGYYDCDKKLRYAGAIGTGFNASDHEALTRLFARQVRRASPFADPLPKRGVTFLNPLLVAEVEYRRWPDGGLVQQGAFKGLRPDKNPTDVMKEQLPTSA
jgi:bifunctional non-homologous end joining protein LigD